MCSKKTKRGNDNYESRENSRFNDGKHFNKKHKNEDKRSRNNVKQSLRKELLDY